MSYFVNFPYTNFHNLNLNWIMEKIKTLNAKFDEAISAKIKFADPIAWNITKQYEQLTIVIDNNKAYLSMQPVPSGISIDNTEYWQNIFDMSELYAQQAAYEQEMDGKYEEFTDNISDDFDTFQNNVSDQIADLDEKTLKTNSEKHIL